MSTPDKTSVCIIGGGSAGLSCAWSLARNHGPLSYDVTVLEKADVCGGVATSHPISATSVGDGKRCSSWINDGVQGAAPCYRNTLLLHETFGFKPTPLNMMVAFGKGDDFWTNRTSSDDDDGKGRDPFETPLIGRLRDEIKKFGRVLTWIYRLEYVFAFVPIWVVLTSLSFSKDFQNKMVYPLVALFFGTGNQTPYVSAAIVARVFMDDRMKLFDYDEGRLLSQQPLMYAFDSLENIYQSIGAWLNEQPNCSVRTGTAVSSVVRLESGKVEVKDQHGGKAIYDHVVFACDAETALAVHQNPTWMERFVLGNVTYYDDVSVTHTDDEYMKEHYHIDEDLDRGKGDQYFIYTSERDPSKLEMSFNLSNYQHQLDGLATDGQSGSLYQSIFLDKKGSDLWTMDKIDRDKTILVKWWRQMAHTWKHFAGVVPLVRFIQGTRGNTWYCGSYTMFNIHEIAVGSGFAAADRLGAPHPFPEDSMAVHFFKLYLGVSHGVSPLSQKGKRPASLFKKISTLLGIAALILAIGLAL